MEIINSEDYRNQKQIILEHLKQYGDITTLDAYNKYKIVRLGSVIHLLRKEGYKIITCMEHNKDKSKRFARYFLKD